MMRTDPNAENHLVAHRSAELIKTIFHAWNSANINFLVLRNYATLPYALGNDVDILMMPDDRAGAESLAITEAARRGFRCHNRVEFSHVALFFYHTESHEQVHIDLFTSLDWQGFSLLAPKLVLERKVMKDLFSIPNPVHEATLNLLTGVLYNGKVRDKYKRATAETFARYPDQAQAVLELPFGRKLSNQVVHSVIAQDWRSVEAVTQTLRLQLVIRQLLHAPRATLQSLAGNFLRLLRRIKQPPGLMIVLLGTDGSGKTTVGEKLIQSLDRSFGRQTTLHLHWKPSVFRAAQATSSAPVTDPHGRGQRSRIASIAYFIFHLLDFIIGAYLRISPLLFRNGLVIIDRYYHDFFVDQIRYRLSVPGSLIRGGFIFVMKPHLVFCLDVPAHVIQRRKQELPYHETIRQRAAHADLAHALSNGYVVDATRPLNDVTAELRAAILAYMHERYKTRSDPTPRSWLGRTT